MSLTGTFPPRHSYLSRQTFWEAEGYFIREEEVWDNCRRKKIWVIYRGENPQGNLRVIGQGPYADMEFRFTNERGEHKAVRAPLAGATNPVDACLAFAHKYLA